MANPPATGAPTISTHVLDAERGAPAVGVHVTLYKLGEDGRAIRLTQALTDGDGRIRDLLERPLSTGDYRLEFTLVRDRPDDGAADADALPSPPPSAAATDDRFFRRLSLDLRVSDVTRSYHVPLLLSPYAMTTYRGS